MRQIEILKKKEIELRFVGKEKETILAANTKVRILQRNENWT